MLLLGLFWYWEFRLNQINNLTLLLIVASFVHWQQKRRGLAGFWLGLAVLLKLTPGLIVVWFALKRQYKTVLLAGLTFLLAGPVGDLIVFRPDHAVGVYRHWFEAAVVEGSQRGLIIRQKEMDWRNQGLGAVASRWLHPTNYALHFDNDPRIKTSKKPVTMNVADLSTPTVARIVLIIAGLSVAGLFWLTRRPAEQLNTWQLRAEWALYLAAMLWLMPVLRRYHLVLLLPPMAVLASAIHYAGPHRRWTKLALLGAYGVAACQFAVMARVLPDMGILNWLPGALGDERAAAVTYALNAGVVEAAGVLLLGVVLVALPLVVLLIQLARRPNVLPVTADAPESPADEAGTTAARA